MKKSFEQNHGLAATAAYRQRIRVQFEYPVFFTRDSLAPDNPQLMLAFCSREHDKRHRVFVTVDSGVAAGWPDLSERIRAYFAAHAERLELLGDPFIVPGGEQCKNTPELIEELQSQMQKRGVDRHSFCLCIGGGAVLDAVGYAAATTHRGVRHIRMPTTVLAQDDSGVGVKNAVNAFGAKNFLGTFAPPFAVVNDSDFLRTLDPRDLRAGMAEAVKVALIRDYRFFTWLEAHVAELARFEDGAMATLIRTAAEIHMDHIASGGDPFETGSARPLDFGHWAAHKLEALTGHQVRHGEAVAIGLALDSRYSHEIGELSEPELERICALLEGVGLRLWHPALLHTDAEERLSLLNGLREFREHLGGELTVTLLRGLGRSVEVHSMDTGKVTAALHWLKARDAARCG
jgi:3-dehydroquinate synthase